MYTKEDEVDLCDHVSPHLLLFVDWLSWRDNNPGLNPNSLETKKIRYNNALSESLDGDNEAVVVVVLV